MPNGTEKFVFVFRLVVCLRVLVAIKSLFTGTADNPRLYWFLLVMLSPSLGIIAFGSRRRKMDLVREARLCMAMSRAYSCAIPAGMILFKLADEAGTQAIILFGFWGAFCTCGRVWLWLDGTVGLESWAIQLLLPGLTLSLAVLVRVIVDSGVHGFASSWFVSAGVSLLLLNYTIRALGLELAKEREGLQKEVQRCEHMVAELERTARELADSRKAFSCILNALCDAVVHVNSSLVMQNPSPQLHDILYAGQPGDFSQLHGRSLGDFIASRDDVGKLEECMGAAKAGPSLWSQGAAPCLNIQMQDASGATFSMEVYHARMQDGDGHQVHVLGLRARHGVCAEALSRAIRDCPRARAEAPQKEAFPAASATAAAGADAGSVASGQSSQHSAAADRMVASLAVPFDAGTDEFDVLGSPPIFSPHKHQAAVPGLESCVHPAQQERFARWVEGEINNSSWFSSSKSSPFPGSLILDLPAVPRRAIRAKRAWIEIGLPDPDVGELPAVLWLEDIETKHGRRGRGSGAGPSLPPVDEQQEDEEDDDASMTEVTPDDSISCAAMRGRRRPRG